jgi:hypothetical protein
VVKALEKTGVAVQIGPEKRGYYGDIDRHDSYETQAFCKGETVTFALVEKQRMERHEPDPKDKARGWPWDRPTTTYHPSGKLELRLTNFRLSGMRKSWGDGKRQHLEDCLGSFVAHVSVAADQLAELRALAERREAAWRETEERRAAEKRRREEDERRSAALLARVTRWRQAQDIRSYVAAATERLEEAVMSPDARQRHRRELQWALDYAQRISPLTDIEALEPFFAGDADDD